MPYCSAPWPTPCSMTMKQNLNDTCGMTNTIMIGIFSQTLDKMSIWCLSWASVVFCFHFHCPDKISQPKLLRGGKASFSSQFQVTGHHFGEVKAETQAAVTSHPRSRTERKKCTLAACLPRALHIFTQFRTQLVRWCHPHSWWDFPFQLTIKALSPRHSLRLTWSR